VLGTNSEKKTMKRSMREKWPTSTHCSVQGDNLVEAGSRNPPRLMEMEVEDLALERAVMVAILMNGVLAEVKV
jgi:hypothetical protein